MTDEIARIRVPGWERFDLETKPKKETVLLECLLPYLYPVLHSIVHNYLYVTLNNVYSQAILQPVVEKTNGLHYKIMQKLNLKHFNYNFTDATEQTLGGRIFMNNHMLSFDLNSFKSDFLGPMILEIETCDPELEMADLFSSIRLTNNVYDLDSICPFTLDILLDLYGFKTTVYEVSSNFGKPKNKVFAFPLPFDVCWTTRGLIPMTQVAHDELQLVVKDTKKSKWVHLKLITCNIRKKHNENLIEHNYNYYHINPYQEFIVRSLVYNRRDYSNDQETMSIPLGQYLSGMIEGFYFYFVPTETEQIIRQNLLKSFRLSFEIDCNDCLGFGNNNQPEKIVYTSDIDTTLECVHVSDPLPGIYYLSFATNHIQKKSRFHALNVSNLNFASLLLELHFKQKPKQNLEIRMFTFELDVFQTDNHAGHFVT
jgi:hypothetical protein